MNHEFKCPYCGQDSYAKTSKKSGKFESWNAVVRHTSRCLNNSHEYIISTDYGILRIEDLTTIPDIEKLFNKYPLLKKAYRGYIRKSKKYGLLDSTFRFKKVFYTEQELLDLLITYVQKHGKIPSSRDFKHTKPNYTNFEEKFGSWNNAIKAAGFIPNIQNGFGIDTYGLDGRLYRSKHEAYFADTYLYKKYEYEIEPKYPKPYNKYYDWYIPSLDLYIELNGGLRPETTKEKIEINKTLNRKCIFIDVSNIYIKSSLLDFI